MGDGGIISLVCLFCFESYSYSVIFFPPKDIAVISSRIVINLEEKWKKENNIVMLDQSEAGMNVLNFSPDDKSKSSGASPCRADKNHAIMD